MRALEFWISRVNVYEQNQMLSLGIVHNQRFVVRERSLELKKQLVPFME